MRHTDSRKASKRERNGSRDRMHIWRGGRARLDDRGRVEKKARKPERAGVKGDCGGTGSEAVCTAEDDELKIHPWAGWQGGCR